MRRRHDPTAGEAEADPDRGEPDTAAPGPPWASGARPRLRLGREKQGLVDEALPELTLEFQPGHRRRPQCGPEPAQGRCERELLRVCGWSP